MYPLGMDGFDYPFWNLAQAAVWVVYREKGFVEQMANADRDSYAAVGMYPSMWPKNRRRYAEVSDLYSALLDGRLQARGYHVDTLNTLYDIPAAQWQDMALYPPVARLRREGTYREERWTQIRLESADVKRLWRSTDEVNSRAKYDWDAIRELYEVAKRSNPDFSQNRLIEEVQLAYQQRFVDSEPPSRSSIQRHIKDW